ncbi:MAG: hypothetical protein ACFFBP_18425 [Promethearchaeota archaeon]
MVQVHGKYITFCGRLMNLYKDDQKKADQALYNKIGKHFSELEPEGWYDGELLELFLNTYIEASPLGMNALVNMGKNIFPIIKQTVGLPDFERPSEALRYESQTFLNDHKDDDVSKVIPREIIKFEEGHVIIQAPAPAKSYDALLFKGVFIGILEMFGIETSTVEIIDKDKSIFEITW